MARRTSECPNIDGCRMFTVFTFVTTLEIWKDNYCTSDFQRCERYRKACGGEPVPDLLLPNGRLLRKL